MDQLREYYRTRLRVVVTLLVGLAILFRQLVEPSLPAEYRSAVLWAGSALVGAIFLVAEWFIRTCLWKFERRGLDFSGLWEGTAVYTSVEKPGERVEGASPLPSPARHTARIDQNCLGIQIEATGEPFVWYSVAMDISSKGLRYAYEISYRKTGFPRDHVIGYETTTAVEYGRSWFGRKRPVKLMGTFAHCAQGQAPVYRGTIVFDLADATAKKPPRNGQRGSAGRGKRSTT
jgi:hypothetical protein